MIDPKPYKDECGGWTFPTMLVYIEALLTELDLRYKQRFEAQENALQKAEAAQDAKNTTLNELRGVVTDQQGAFARSAVVDLQIKAIESRVSSIELDIRGLKERGEGKHTMIGYVTGAIGLAIALAAIWFRMH